MRRPLGVREPDTPYFPLMDGQLGAWAPHVAALLAGGLGVSLGATFWARSAQIALAKLAEAEEEAQRPDPFYQAKLQTARFYFTRLMPETSSLMRRIRAGSDVLMDTDAALA